MISVSWARRRIGAALRRIASCAHQFGDQAEREHVISRIPTRFRPLHRRAGPIGASRKRRHRISNRNSGLPYFALVSNKAFKFPPTMETVRPRRQPISGDGRCV